MKVRTQYSVLQGNIQNKSWNQYSVLCYETQYCYPSIILRACLHYENMTSSK